MQLLCEMCFSMMAAVVNGWWPECYPVSDIFYLARVTQLWLQCCRTHVYHVTTCQTWPPASCTTVIVSYCYWSNAHKYSASKRKHDHVKLKHLIFEPLSIHFHCTGQVGVWNKRSLTSWCDWECGSMTNIKQYNTGNFSQNTRNNVTN